jgi:DNA adenine methylase Dam
MQCELLNHYQFDDKIIKPFNQDRIKIIDNHYIQSPLNYIGGKYKLLTQLQSLFPKKINTFIDLFAGGFNVGININQAKHIICNDYMFYIVELYQTLHSMSIEAILDYINYQITKFELSKTNSFGYHLFREYYNINKNPLDLYILICFAFNHQIRFNSNHYFNTPFGKNRSSFNETLKNKLIQFHKKLITLNISFSNLKFIEYDISNLQKQDFIYCDPPYLISNGSYNDGKRGFDGWSITEEYQLLSFLEEANSNNIKFALSNLFTHKGSSNEILISWAKKYNINKIQSNYSNSNYQLKNRNPNTSMEVLITNY